MASSRDDFIIAIRSAFLKKSTQQKFSLLTLASISVFIIVLSSLDFKAVRYGINSKTEVYNLKEDESETIDIANLHPKIVEKAEQIFLSERSDTFGFPYGGVVQDFIPEN